MAGRSKRRRKWWRKRNPFAHVRKARRYLEEHERDIIIADLTAIGGQGSWFDMERHAPGRYDPRYFDATLDRMSPSWVKYKGRTRMFGSKVWCLATIDGEPAHKEMEGRQFMDMKDPKVHLDMMGTPDTWPLGHVLPLARGIGDDVPMPEHDLLCFDTIRGGQRREFGIMLLHAAIPRWTVFRLNLHDMRMRSLFITGVADETITTYTDYTSAEEVYGDGWRVQ